MTPPDPRLPRAKRVYRKENDMEFRTAYERCEHKGIEFSEPTMAQQSFKDECDVNNIIARYTQTGVIPDYLTQAAEGVYGDFSEVGDYTDMQNQIIKAKESFAALPSDVRRRFNEDPAQLIAFVRNKDNYDEAVKLGLVNKSVDTVINSSPAGEEKQ